MESKTLDFTGLKIPRDYLSAVDDFGMNEKPLTVHEVVNLTGITARTLHYYDEIGL